MAKMAKTASQPGAVAVHTTPAIARVKYKPIWMIVGCSKIGSDLWSISGISQWRRFQPHAGMLLLQWISTHLIYPVRTDGRKRTTWAIGLSGRSCRLQGRDMLVNPLWRPNNDVWTRRKTSTNANCGVHNHQILQKMDKDSRSPCRIQSNLGPEFRFLQHDFAHSRFGGL